MTRTLTTLLAAVVLLSACNNYKKTPSGLAYKITKGGAKETLKNGQIVKFNIEYKVTPKDSLLMSSFGHIPTYMIVDTARPAKHSFLEIITQCGVGDKVEFVMSVDTLKKLGMIDNSMFKARDMIHGRVEILKTFATTPEAQADLQNEQKTAREKETKVLKEYCEKKGIKTQTTPNGVLVEIQNAGDMTQKADTGKQLMVLYKGTFLDGKQFDTNIDKNNPNSQPLPVIIGGRSVIDGLDEGLRLFGKGGKGRIFVPSLLGYGDRGSQPVIPPYSNLVFEVEVLSVGTPAPQPAQPGMQTPQQH
jgi:FKBP-type peptidyl-prolyl cis-trans isomerase FkpA